MANRKHRCGECRGRKRLPGLVKVRGMGTGMGSTVGDCPSCEGFGYIEQTDELTRRGQR